ncbi:MAG: DUF885 family protein [Caulobacteraceae bacterium]|nr:DUF885 family protein [Caulobacteraceae bacterium]
MHISRRVLLSAGAASAAVLAGCASNGATGVSAGGDPSTRMNEVLDRSVANSLRRSPERCTSLGLTEERAGYRFIDKVSDASKQAAREAREQTRTSLNELRAIDRESLPARDKVTYDVVATAWANNLASAEFEVGGGAGAPYVVTQLTGAYRSMPNFLNEQHPLRTTDEAEGYVARINGFVGQLEAETGIIAEDAAAGVIPPDFVIDKAIGQLTRFAEGGANQNLLVQSLVRRLPDAQAIPEASRAGYVSRAETAVRDGVIPAVRRQIEALQRIRPRATHDAGIWRLPRGAEMYAAALVSRTTTTMSPDEIHNVGVELIAQLNGEMDAILRAEGLTRGTVAERVQEISRRPDQLYPNTDAGRDQILADLNAQTREIVAMMPRAFNTLAQAQLEIKRVPPFTEAGAPGGYYQRAALDGSRPGAYFINLRDTAEWPRFTLPTLNYHEGVPGHHWQISIQQESGSIPFIRSAMLGFSAFSEGWGLYAEQLADELGAYQNNRLGRLGYLQSATFRASRLVCDTGLHAKRWTREQAIQSMMQATGDLESSVTTEIERYCVQPGQACAYMIGRQAINRIRQQSTTTLGARFDLKAFHDTMLANGAVPLSVLERVLADWAAAQG